MTDTKSAMKDDMKLAKAKTLLVRAGLDADKTLKQLVAKYGANTYDIVLNAMLKPTDMMIAAGQKFANTKKTIEYYASHQVSDVQLAKAINKTKAEIAKRSAQKGTSSTTNRQASTRASARSERFNNRVSNRAPSKTSAVNQNKHNANAKTKGIPFKSEEGLGYKAPWSANKTPTPAKSQTTKGTTQKTPAVKTTTSPKQTTNSTPGTVPYANNSGIVVEMPWHKNTQEEQSGQFAWQVAKVTTPEDVYNKSFEGRSDKVSLDELMKKTGVTQADIQAVFKAHPEIVQEMGGGKTNQALARAASQVRGACDGGCLGGVQQKIYAKTSVGLLIDGSKGQWPEKIPQAEGWNSACNVYIPLEKSGRFITLTYPNKAYNKAENSKEVAAMKEFNKSLPAGTTVCIDNKIPDGKRGKAGLNDGEIHGHTWVLDNTKASCSDGRQEDGPKFSRYGKNMHISIAKDNCISKDLALMLIKQKQEREALALAKAHEQNRGRA